MHLAMAFVRRHRSGSGLFSPFVLPSFLLAATPWLWATPLALVAAAVAHVAWFVACEWLAPPAARPTAPSAARAHRAAAGPATSHASTGSVPTARGATAPAPGFAATPVITILEETDEIKTFRLARPDGLTFTAGQFVAVRVSVGGKPHVRCYSISSSPDARGYLEISVRRQGLVSTTLHTTLRSGSVLAISQPAGQFVYPAGDDRPLALLAGGIGITPLLAMLRHAVLTDPTRPISLLYSARRLQDAAFVRELSLIAERYPHVRIGLTFSGGNAPPPWRAGHIDAAMLRQYVSHPAHTIFCICGPTSMMAAMDQLLRNEDVPSDQIRSERFETAVAATLVNTATPTALAPGRASGRDEYQVTFASSGRAGRAGAAQTLLEIAEREGVAIASSCRSGVCLTCRTRLADGDADCRSSMLDPDDRAAGFILPCVAWATTDCVLEA
jgi:ferredoxin-NADP reductase